MLFDTRALNFIGHAADRAERRVELETSDRLIGVFRNFAGRCRLVTASACHLQRHVQLAVLTQTGDMVGRIDNLHVVVEHDVTGENHAGAAFVQRQRRFLARMHVDRETLQIEEDVGNVLLNTFERRVLVQHVFNFGLYNRAARHR